MKKLEDGKIEKIVLRDDWRKIKPHIHEFDPVIELAQGMNALNWHIFRSHGTAEHLSEASCRDAKLHRKYWQPGNTIFLGSKHKWMTGIRSAIRHPDCAVAYYGSNTFHWIADWTAQLARAYRPDLMWGGLVGGQYAVAAGFVPDENGKHWYFIQESSDERHVEGSFMPVRVVAIADHHGSFAFPHETPESTLEAVNLLDLLGDDDIHDSFISRKAYLASMDNHHIENHHVNDYGPEPKLVKDGDPWFWDVYPELLRKVDNPLFAEAFAEHSAKLPNPGTVGMFSDRSTRYSSLIHEFLDDGDDDEENIYA